MIIVVGRVASHSNQHNGCIEEYKFSEQGCLKCLHRCLMLNVPDGHPQNSLFGAWPDLRLGLELRHSLQSPLLDYSRSCDMV